MVHVFLVYLDQDETVLVTLQPEFSCREFGDVSRRLAYVDRRVQSFPHLTPADVIARGSPLPIQPARADCRYIAVDDDGLRTLRELEMSRAASTALDGASAADAVHDMKAAIEAIPGYIVAERERLKSAASGAGHVCSPFESWSSPACLALLDESHADLAARISAAAQALERYSLSPTGVEKADIRLAGAQSVEVYAHDRAPIRPEGG